jgi:hypothetical protein
MILIKIIFGVTRSMDWYRDVLPDVPLTIFRMNKYDFSEGAFEAAFFEPKN